MITDTPLLDDWLLQDLLLRPSLGYGRLLEDGVLAPAIRDTHKTFRNVEASTRTSSYRVTNPLRRMRMDRAE